MEKNEWAVHNKHEKLGYTLFLVRKPEENVTFGELGVFKPISSTQENTG
jgi:hypothetical protein